MRCKRRIMAATIFAVLSVCLSGCPNKQAIIASLQDCLEHVAEPGAATVPESVGVYIDTSPSMNGFLTSPDDTATLYSLCLHEMGKLVAGKYNQLSYYRVDTPLWLVEDTEDVLEEARKEYYYHDSGSFSKKYTKIGDGEGYDSLCLTTALNEGTNQDLFILITDFYENSVSNNVNAGKLIAKIKELADSDDGKVFGLIGVKSAFSGKIYDTGPDGETVSYGTEPGTVSFRPFYIIFRGYPQHVQSFCDNMMARLDNLGVQKGVDYAGCTFFEEDFFGLDYTALIGCVNPPTPRENFVWPYGANVMVKDTSGQVGETAIPVYNYKRSRTSGQPEANNDRILYFAYSVDKVHQDEFHTLIDENSKRETRELCPGNPKEVYLIACNTEDIMVAQWDGTAAFTRTTNNGADFFEVKQLYYDINEETLYIAMCLEDQQFTEGLWRLQWKSMLNKTEEQEPWWEQWHSPSGVRVDYSKTERLNEYVEPILEQMPCEGQSILTGVVYLNVKEY